MMKGSEGEETIECFTYGHKILGEQLYNCFKLDFETISESLELGRNEQFVSSVESEGVEGSMGTFFTSDDGLVCLDLITRQNKSYLTKGGGLLQLWRKWNEEMVSQKGILLPIIIAVISLNYEQSVNVVIRLNRIQFKFTESLISNKEWINEIIKQNVIGWASIKQQQIKKRFFVRQIRDNQFNYDIDLYDYKLQLESKTSLLNIIYEDLETLNAMGCFNPVLQIVYLRHSARRLLSLIERERKGQDHSIDMPNEQSSLTFQSIGLQHFEVKSQLGYILVFWDQLWAHNDTQQKLNYTKITSIIMDQF